MLPQYAQPRLSEFQNLYERLIPKNHLLRQYNELIDFSFIRDELEHKYCLNNGRNAESPIRLFKYLLLKIIYKLSDADLIERSRYDMSFKYFLGYKPEDDVIHSTTLTKFRKLRLKDENLLDLLIKKTVQIAIENGIIHSKTIIVDATHTRSRYNQKSAASTLLDTAKSLRKTVYQCEGEEQKKTLPTKIETEDVNEAINYCNDLIHTIQANEKLMFYPAVTEKMNYLREMLDDHIERIRGAADPDARVGHKTEDTSFFGYKTHLAITEERIITAAIITSGEKSDGHQLQALVEKSREAGIKVENVVGDTAYSGKENLELARSKKDPEKGFNLISKLNPIISNSYKNPERNGFIYNKDAGLFVCPEGHMAIRKARTGKKGQKYNQTNTYYFDTEKCKQCPRTGHCYKNGNRSKTYSVTILSGVHQKQALYQESQEFKELARTRYKIEAKNSELKNRHGYNVAHSKGITGMEIQGATTFFVVNMKRIIKLKNQNNK